MSTRCLLDPRKWRDERALRKHLRKTAWYMAGKETDSIKGLQMVAAAEHLDNIKDHEQFMEKFTKVFLGDNQES